MTDHVDGLLPVDGNGADGNGPLVSAEWLGSHLAEAVVLDATVDMPSPRTDGDYRVASGLDGWLPGFFRNLLGPKYSPAELRQAIEGVVGQKTLAEANTRLLIPAYDATMGRVYVFKTPHVPPGDTRDADKRAADVALATSAAPTYLG